MDFASAINQLQILADNHGRPRLEKRKIHSNQFGWPLELPILVKSFGQFNDLLTACSILLPLFITAFDGYVETLANFSSFSKYL